MPAKKKPIQSASPDFWDSIPLRRKHLICLAFLFILPVILFSSSVIGGQQFMGHDVVQWRAGAESLIEFREATGETPHWVQGMFSGMPSATMSHPPQPMNLDTLIKAFQFIYPAVEFWVLLGGLYLFFILMGFRPLSSVFGALLIAFTTYIPIIIGAGHNAKFIAYIYVPWLFVGYSLITRSQLNRFLSLFVFALALALHLKAYHPQVTYYFFFPLAAWFIFDLVQAVKSDTLKPFLQKTGLLVAGTVLASMVVLQIYWSTMEYSSYSIRGGSEVAETTGLGTDYAFTWSQGWGELITLLVPNAYGGAEAYWGPKPVTSGPHYFGALAFLFFVIGLMKSSHNLKWIFAGTGILTLLFSLGNHFMLLNGFMFSYFPLFDKFRTPEMWLITTVFCFSVVAVMGMEFLWDRLKTNLKDREWRKPIAVSGGVGLLVLFAAFSLLSFEKPGERSMIANQIAQQNQVSPDDPRVQQTVSRYINMEMIPQRKEMARADALRFAGFLIVGIGLIWFVSSGKISLSVAGGLLCVITAVDLLTVGNRYISERALTDQSLDARAVVAQSERNLDRFIQDSINDEDGWPYRVFPVLDNPFNNAVPSFFYPSIGGYSGAKLGYYQDVIENAVFGGPNQINTGVMSMLNVKYITLQGAAQIPGYQVVYNQNDGVVLQNLNVLPKAFFVDSLVTVSTPVEALAMMSNDFDPSAVAFVSGTTTITPLPDTTSSARVTRYEPNRIELELQRSEPGFLVLGEIWYPPGWSATLNGEPIEILRTNYILRGFEIPAGQHTLQMTLEPTWYATGNFITRAATIVLFGIGVIGLVFVYRER